MGMTGLVLAAKSAGYRDLLDKLTDFENENIRPELICASGFAAPVGLMAAAGIRAADMEKILSRSARCANVYEAAKIFSAVFEDQNEWTFNFLVPVIDTVNFAQYSYTNVAELASSWRERGLYESVNAAMVAASALFGICPGFEYDDRTYSAGHENLLFCINCQKRAGLNARILS